MNMEIDFLPESYHKKRQCRQKKTWRRGILVVFMLIIGASTYQQWLQQADLEANRDEMWRRARDMVSQLDNPQKLRHQIRLLDDKANLVTLLRVQVPPTRILASVTNRLPDFVTLTEIQSDYQPVGSRSDNQPGTKNKSRDNDSENEAASTIDYDHLKQRRRTTALFVTLSGLAPDDMAVSEYLAGLEQTDDFDDVQLLYTDQHDFRKHPVRKFGIRLRVRTPDASHNRQPELNMPHLQAFEPNNPLAGSGTIRTGSRISVPSVIAERIIR